MGRRAMLKVGAGAFLAGTGALAWRAWDQGVFSTGEGVAYAAWDHWLDGAADAPQRLVAAAVLAASPHNTQPWRFRIAQGRIDLFADRSRNIGSIDPFLREMHIGLGCALENLLLAAAASGWRTRLAMLPDASDVSHVARIELSRGDSNASPLHAAIAQRHTNRGPYAARALEPSVFAALEALGGEFPQLALRWFVTDAQRREIGAHIVDATAAIVADAEQSRDSGAWVRGSWQEVQARRDGLTIDAQALPGWMRVAGKILPPISVERADRMWLDATREVHVGTAVAFGLLLVRDANDDAQRLQGGRLWQRMHLWAQTRGLAMQPLNQLPERADRERSAALTPRFTRVLQSLVQRDDWQALMPFRLGYPTVPALRSPRRAVGEVLLT
ncbi:MAG TPA: hypothetical protein VFU71_03720 [Burkholderiaceae bacterium]|nr:hypothetical protein [Burkholderiaceae bacterium]